MSFPQVDTVNRIERMKKDEPQRPTFTRYDISIILTAAQAASMDPWYFREDYVEDIQEVIDTFRSLAGRIEWLIEEDDKKKMERMQ